MADWLHKYPGVAPQTLVVAARLGPRVGPGGVAPLAGVRERYG